MALQQNVLTPDLLNLLYQASQANPAMLPNQEQPLQLGNVLVKAPTTPVQGKTDFNAQDFGPATGIYSQPAHQREDAQYTGLINQLTNAPNRSSLGSVLQNQPTTYTPGGAVGATGKWESPFDASKLTGDALGTVSENETGSGGDPGGTQIEGNPATMSFGDFMGTYGKDIGKGIASSLMGSTPMGMVVGIATAIANQMDESPENQSLMGRAFEGLVDTVTNSISMTDLASGSVGSSSGGFGLGAIGFGDDGSLGYGGGTVGGIGNTAGMGVGDLGGYGGIGSIGADAAAASAAAAAAGGDSDGGDSDGDAAGAAASSGPF